MGLRQLPLYGEMIRMEFLKMLAYRSTYFTGIINYTIQIGAYYFLWEAIYQDRPQLGGLAKEEMIAYLIVAWVVRAFYFNTLDRQITAEIIEGRIAMELIRPYNYQLVKIARSLGEALFRIIFFTVPSALLFYMLVPFKLPPNSIMGGLFLVSMAGSFLINAQICLFTGLLAFFTYNSSGLIRAKGVLVDLLSGLLLPISFYPGWAQEIIKFLPFQAISYLPNLVYLGKVSTWGGVQILALQGFWGLILFGLNALIWRVAVRQLTVQGG